jgi:GTP-binding protein EngB required for normal cell division
MVTIHQLNKPSLAEIRVNLIIEKLNELPVKSNGVNIFVSGRSASGKTTLGNRLIGESYFLSTGRQNTTQVVNLIEFSCCLRFFDLPGVDGGGRQEGDRLENYNRAALGLMQYPDYPHIEQITVATYNKNQSPKKQTYSLNDFNNMPFTPDLVYYLIDPKKGLTNSEKEYLKDLIESEYPILFVLNTWLDKHQNQLATKQNFLDVAKAIDQLYITSGEEKNPIIVNVNCQTGEGVDRLLEKTSLAFSDERAMIFDQIILEQHAEAPKHYVTLIKHELGRIFVDLAEYKPTSYQDAEERLQSTCLLLWNYLVKLKLNNLEAALQNKLAKTDLSYFGVEKIVKLPIKTIILSIQEHRYVPISASLPFFEIVYEYKRLYRTYEEVVDDHDRPIYENKQVTTDPGILGGIGNILQGKEWENIHDVKVFKGFEKKKVKKKILIGSQRQFSGIQSWQSLIGLKKYSHTTYQPFGIYGLCLLKCFCLASLGSNFKKNYQFKDHINTYIASLKNLEELAGKHEAENTSNKGQSYAILTKNIDIILGKNDFDLLAISTLAENSDNHRLTIKYFTFLKQAKEVIHFKFIIFKVLFDQIIFGLREIFLNGDREQQLDPIGIMFCNLVANYLNTIRVIAIEIFKSLARRDE